MSKSHAATRIEWRLFLAAWLAYAFFHQGGGWIQNAGFATARAVVEEGRFAVDSYLFYSAAVDTEDGYRLTRTPIENGAFRLHGADWDVGWSSEDAVQARDSGRKPVPLGRIFATGALAYSEGHFYLQRAPGTALLAVPGYFLIHLAERMVGLDPDDWWVLTVNGWLTTALGVGLLSALGCVVFFRATLLLWGGAVLEATWATLAFAFATLFFPYATILFEHNVVAVLLLASFYFLLRARDATPGREATLALLLAGLTAGYAAISAYVAAIPVMFLATYLVLQVKGRHRWLWFGLGLAGPILLLCFYNQSCFGAPFTTGYHLRDPRSIESGVLSSLIGLPRFARLAEILVSPFRGLFFSSPVLLMGVAGWVAMWRGGRRAEAWVCSLMLGYFVLYTISLKGLYGRWGVGPQYLVPALPFLALPLAAAFRRYFKTTLALALFSALTMACFTAVDVKSPVGLGAVARHPGRSTLLREPLTEYALPLLFTGRAWPILNAQIDEAVLRAEETLRDEGESPGEAQARLETYRERLEASVRDGGTELPLALFRGPVSASPVGMYEGKWGHVFKPGEPELRWNAFNAGELVLPHSAWSLLLLMILWLPLSGSAIRIAREDEDGAPARATALWRGSGPDRRNSAKSLR